MCELFEIQSGSGTYGVEIGQGLLMGELCRIGDAVILCDRCLAGRLASANCPVILIEASEAAKSLDRISEVIIQMREAGATRNTRIIAIGGGVMQDIATFCASVYMRGIEWDYLPTTILGMADSCIGGKSSLNVGQYKNIVGNFFPPKKISIDIDFVASLSEEQRIAGLCEAAKICFARGDEAFQHYLGLRPEPFSHSDILREVIATSLSAKKWFIEIDEFDRKERQLLNYGHTFGHAIESATRFAVSHGIAVGFGILAANRLAELLGRYTETPACVESLNRHVSGLLSRLEGLNHFPGNLAGTELLECFSADKKHSKSHYAVILPGNDGKLERILLDKTFEHRKNIISAFEFALRKHGQ